VIGSDRRAGAYSLAGIHQLGAPKRNIPPRPFFPFNASGEATEKAKGKVRAVIVRWLNILGK
jgi:phage gpG-like protein